MKLVFDLGKLNEALKMLNSVEASSGKGIVKIVIRFEDETESWIEDVAVLEN